MQGGNKKNVKSKRKARKMALSTLITFQKEMCNIQMYTYIQISYRPEGHKLQQVLAFS